MEWIVTKDSLPNDGQYYVKVCYKSNPDYTSKMVMERFMGSWVYDAEDMDDDLQVTEWLFENVD